MARRTLDDVVGAALADEVEIDFSGAREGGDFEVLPAGDYEAIVKSCEPGTSGTGNPKLVFQFEITDAKAKGRVVFKHCPTKGEGAGITRDVLRAIGFDTDAMRAFKPSAAIGRPCTLKLGIQTDNPEFNEVKKVKPRVASKASVTGAAKPAGVTKKAAAAKPAGAVKKTSRRLS